MYIIIVMICVFFLLFFSMGLLWVYWKSGKMYNSDRESSSPFECGFDSSSKSRLPFSVRFFVLLVFFLMFDVELVLLLQLPFTLEDFFFKVMVVYNLFFWVLFLGLLEEWRRGVLSWKK